MNSDLQDKLYSGYSDPSKNLRRCCMIELHDVDRLFLKLQIIATRLSSDQFPEARDTTCLTASDDSRR